MPWRELQIPVPRVGLDRVSAALFAAGCAGVQEDYLPGQRPAPRQPWDTGPLPPEPAIVLVRAWFEDPDQSAVEATIADLGAGEPTWSSVDDIDWEAAWRSRFAPIRASARLTVAPPWDAPAGAIVIEPGQGFGTGHHPTTVAALAQLDAIADGARTALDVGCGSGVLSIAAARLGLAARGIDVDPHAVANARANAVLNAVQVPFDTTPIGEVRDAADLVLANLYAEVLVDLAPDLIRLTGRWLVLAGILADREPVVRRAFASLQLEDRVADDEWVCLRFRA